MGGAASKTVKTIGSLIIGVIGMGLGITTLGMVNWMFEIEHEKKQVASAPRLNLSIVADDYINNKMRYEEKWEYEWLKYSGRIANIENKKITIDAGWIATVNSRGQRASVYCNIDDNNIDEFTRFNRGDQIDITGKLWAHKANKGMNGHWKFTLSQCRLS